MNPTQLELATIAASITGATTPAERVKAALDLWNAAGAALDAAKGLEEIKAKVIADMEETRALFAGRKTIPLDEYLAHLMPGKKPDDRITKYRSYLRDNIAFCDQATSKQPRSLAKLDKAVAEIIRTDKELGISQNNFANRARETRRIIELEAAATRTERAKKGAKAKAEKK